MNIATILYLLLGITGLALFVAGAYVLLGVGWSLLAGSLAAFTAAAFIRRGLISG
ncbi:hypothetical protein [Azotobacter vinelandii]|uniref:hypothetical protein n=1 Tax=Azotobacter vinelandii TaxID=354 RepID=UPI0009198A6A|nr:hypothetical protein [Azotobacter vinelandii]SFY16458.1 hypothetical protein SAMN04244547_04266 [Azotobacter vinelandii]